MTGRTTSYLCLAVTSALLGLPGCTDDNAPPVAAASPTTSTSGASAISPADIDKSLDAAQNYLSSGMLDEAESILQVLVHKVPNEPSGHEMLALVHLARAHQARQTGDDAAAQIQGGLAFNCYKRTLSLLPNDAGLHQSAGEVAHTIGKTNEALDHYLRAAAIDPANPKHPLYAAQVYLSREEWGEAKSQLNRVLAIDPDEPYAHASLASIESRLGDVDAALAHVLQARLLVPNDLVIRVQHASILRGGNRPREGLELLIGLPGSERGQEFAAAEIAACYLALDQPMEAARAWELCHEASLVSPRAWFAAVSAGQCLLLAGEREQAWLWLQQAKQTAANQPEIRALESAIAAAQPADD